MKQSSISLENDLVDFSFDGQIISAKSGQSVVAALMQIGQYHLRHDEFGAPKGAFCCIGFCWECRCRVNGVSNERACLTEVKAGMLIETQKGLE